jgi:glyoxylase-like metal-dependent hydrolase (beta-lactamase superfamily II)
MIAPGTLAYYGKTKGWIPTVASAHRFRERSDHIPLLWGDVVYVIAVDGATARVSAKGHHVALPVDDLMEDGLLSIYQIDCGQGDAALVSFPDGRWMLVDGGPGHDSSNSGKIAADFLYWKMFVDQSWKNEFAFRTQPFHLDAVVCTHPDYDHYGGLVALTQEVRKRTLEFGTVYHGGLARYAGTAPEGVTMSQLGPLAEGADGRFVTALVDGFEDVATYGQRTGDRDWALATDYGRWLEELRALHGGGVGDLRRVGLSTGYLPGFEAGTSPVAVKVLGPVQESHAGKPALRYLDALGAAKAPSLTRNGHSVVLRLDYGDVRILLTGDLNFRAQALLLSHVPASEFQSQVVKACHHGSEDVSWTFLKAVSPLVTMISSGDNEAYAHPRAKVLGLAGAFGRMRSEGRTQEYLGLGEERYVAPLVYSTELSRSIELFEPYAVFDARGERVRNPQLQARGRTRRDGGRRGKLRDWLLGDRMVYGLINMRTDGRRILMGVLNEGSGRFQVEELLA